MGRPPKAKPVPVEEDNSSDGDIPHKAPAKKPADSEDEDEDSEEGEEYVVEEILGHTFDRNLTLYEVKWEGYDEHSFEPEENLENCKDELQSYFNKIGGRPVSNKQKAKKGTKRKADNGNTATPEPASKKADNTKKGAAYGANAISDGKGTTITAPAGRWDPHIVNVQSVFQNPDNNDLMGILQWDSQYKNLRSTHTTKILHQKTPQKLLEFYESRLQFNQVAASPKPPAEPLQDDDEDSFEDAPTVPSGDKKVSINDAVDDDGDTFVKDVAFKSG